MAKTVRKDCRAISDEFLQDFCVGGDLGIIVDYLRKHKELNFCFRGNTGNQYGTVIIYKYNHKVVEITKYMNEPNFKFKMGFDFKHARYSEDWEKYKEILRNNGWFFKPLDYSNNGIKSIWITNQFREIKPTELEQTLDVICNIIEDYFNLELKYDYFHKRIDSKKHDLEKIRQQELHATSTISNTGLEYFVYDLEFTKKGAMLGGNKPDFLALKFVDGIVEGLVIGEVKSKKGSLNGGSGLIEHLDGMSEQAQAFNTNNERMLEAAKILRDYAKLNLKGLKQEDAIRFTDDNFVNLKFVEIMIVLTDGAISTYESTGKGKETYRDIIENKYKGQLVIVKKFVDGKLEDI